MTLNVNEPTDQRLVDELPTYIRENREAINAIEPTEASIVEEAFNVESANDVEAATNVTSADNVENAVSVDSADNVESVENIETNSGAVAIATNIEVSNGAVATATNIVDADTVTTGTNVEDASVVTTGTNVEAASAVQDADNIESVTSGNITNVTNIEVSHDAIITTAEVVNEYIIPELTRSRFSYRNGDTIYIGPGVYLCKDKLAYITSTLTSPAHGDGGQKPMYLYIDYSAIPVGGVIDNGDIYWDDAAPVFSNSLLGAYHSVNTDDVCIFGHAIYTDVFIPFHHDGDFVSTYIPFVEGTPSNAWADLTNPLPIPTFSRKVLAEFEGEYDTGDSWLEYRVDAAGSTMRVLRVTSVVTEAVSILPIVTDDSQMIQWKVTITPAADSYQLKCTGFYLPDYM